MNNKTILDVLPKYPEQRQLTLDDKELYEKWYELYGYKLSDFSFTDMYTWSSYHKNMASNLDGHLIWARHYTTGEIRAYFPLGPNPAKNRHFEQIFNYLKISYPNEKRIIYDIPQQYVNSMTSSGFNPQEDRNNFEYIHAREDLAHLKGRKFDGKRHNIKTCLANFNCTYEEIKEKNIEECINFENEWIQEKKSALLKNLTGEHHATLKGLQEFKQLNLLGGAIRINGIIKAFTIAHKLDNETAVIHFEKAAPHFPGLYQVINNWFALNSLSNFKYVNREQDMGLPGLRKAKLSYYPIGFNQKYTISV